MTFKLKTVSDQKLSHGSQPSIFLEWLFLLSSTSLILLFMEAKGLVHGERIYGRDQLAKGLVHGER